MGITINTEGELAHEAVKEIVEATERYYYNKKEGTHQIYDDTLDTVWFLDGHITFKGLMRHLINRAMTEGWKQGMGRETRNQNKK